jgi:hypothetical protein
MMDVKLALRAGRPIAYCSVLLLLIVSVIEVFNMIADVIRDLEKHNEILLLAALAAAFVPSAAMLFWVCKAIATELERARQHFRARPAGRSRHPSH